MPLDVPAQQSPKIPRMGVILVVLFIISALLGLFYMNMSGNSEIATNGPISPLRSPASSVSSTTNSLGGQIYEKAQNPLDGKLETQAPVANPINDAYKNPFE